MKYLNATSVSYLEHTVGTDDAAALAVYTLKDPASWPANIAGRSFQLPETVNINGWCCNELRVGGLLRSPNFTFLKRRGRKPPHLDEMATALLPWLEWADEQLATLKAKLDAEAAAYEDSCKQRAMERTRDDIIQRIYNGYYAEAKRKLNTEERIALLLREAEDSARADIAFNWAAWTPAIQESDYVVLETGRVKLPPKDLQAAVEAGVKTALDSLMDGTFRRPPSLSLRGG